jgi:hypothetical protein
LTYLAIASPAASLTATVLLPLRRLTEVADGSADVLISHAQAKPVDVGDGVTAGRGAVREAAEIPNAMPTRAAERQNLQRPE